MYSSQMKLIALYFQNSTNYHQMILEVIAKWEMSEARIMWR